MKILCKLAMVLILCVAAVSLTTAARADDATDRVYQAAELYRSLVQAPVPRVPGWVLKQAKCLAIFPSVSKVAIVLGARHGKGVASCRNAQGAWSPPAFVKFTGGSLGIQLGGKANELIIFFLNEKDAQSLARRKFTMGVEAAAAAGSKGGASVSRFGLDTYAYADARGLFAGVAFDGASLRPDNKAGSAFYGGDTDNYAILFEHRAPKKPAAAEAFMKALR